MDRSQQQSIVQIPPEEGDSSRPRNCEVHQLRPNWFCVEPGCTASTRFACGDCFLESGPHEKHTPKRLIEFERIVLRRLSDKLPKFKELQIAKEIRDEYEKVFKEIRETFNSHMEILEKSVELEIRKVEHHFNSRSLNQFHKNFRSLRKKLIFFKFVFCEEDQSNLSLQLFDNEDFLDPQLLKERNKRDAIIAQFKEHQNETKTACQTLFKQLDLLSTHIQINQPNDYIYENFESKTCIANETQEKPHKSAIRDVLTLPSNKMLSISDDSTINIYNENLKILRTIPQVTKISNVDLLSDNKIILSHSDYSITLWSLNETAQGGDQCIRKYEGHSGLIMALRTIMDNRFASGSTDGNLILWSSETEESIAINENIHEGTIYAIESLGNNNSFVSGGEDCKIRLWKDLEVIQTMSGHEKPVQKLRYLNGKNMLVSADAQGAILLWNLQDFSLIVALREEFTQPLVSIVQMSTELCCLIGSDQVVKICKVQTDQTDDQSQKATFTVLTTFNNQCSQILAVTKFDDELLVAGCQDGYLAFIK